MDTIFIRGIQVHGRHGCLPEEQVLGQRFIIHLELELDLRGAGSSDALEHSVNYAEVYQLAQSIATNERFNLIEALGEAICQKLLTTFSALHAVRITVEKPSAPIAGIFDQVGITLHRVRA